MRNLTAFSLREFLKATSVKIYFANIEGLLRAYAPKVGVIPHHMTIKSLLANQITVYPASLSLHNQPTQRFVAS